MDDPYAADARFYDLVHADAPQDDLGLWLSFAGRTSRPVLEVGTGTGRVALCLSSHGHDVTALDPSAAMLAVARARAANEGLAVNFVHGRATEAGLPQAHFGFAVVPADVFLYCADVDEQLATLRAVAGALHFNGTLVVDLPGPAMWLDPTSNGQPVLVFRGQCPDGRLFETWHVREDDLAAQERRLQVRYESLDESGAVHRVVSVHILRYVYRYEAEILFRLAGLTLEGMYGDYDLGELTTDAERMIVVARRADG